jgi:predicted phage baseplate assembly protein
MPLLLPNLDDRKWADLVDEGRALIPVYGPEWTDHNASDPGITLIELLAWIAEMDIYELNQVSDRDRLKFLRLVDVIPQPPQPASAVLRITLADGATPLLLPAGVEFVNQDASPVAMRYRTCHEVTLAPGTVEALQFRNGVAFQDLTRAWRRKSAVNPFGADPKPGMEFYIGLSKALPVDTSVEFFFTLGGDRSGWEDRRRILEEQCARDSDCRPRLNPCYQKTHDPHHHEDHAVHTGHGATHKPAMPLIHYGVRTVWEFLGLSGGTPVWLPLDAAAKQVEDNTRSFTLSGNVVFRLPGAMATAQIGAVPGDLSYLRCRVAAGSYDAAPMLLDAAFNGVAVEQAAPYGMEFAIDAAATITYAPQGPPKPGDVTPLTMALDAKMTADRKWKIVALNFGGDLAKDPGFLIYDYSAPAGGTAGKLAIEGAFLGFGTGFPIQKPILPDAPVERESFQLYTLEQKQWHRWKLRYDFDASSRRDFDVQFDPSTGTVTFGDGEKGRVPPELRAPGAPPLEQCLIFAQYRSTRAQAGNLAAGRINQLADSPHNHVVLSDWSTAKAEMTSIANPLPAAGGAAAETLAHASGRADSLVKTSKRAVTLADYERLAMQTPGTHVARVTARANLHPSFPCLKAPGIITVIVLPFLPLGRPTSTPGLLATVRAYLRRRRIVGTRVEVVGPTYLEVSVRSEVQPRSGVNKAALQNAVVAALNKFLDPLAGGPEGSGWPFGRDVYRSEIMRVIDEVPGVDYVASLELIGGDDQPRCGNVCLSPTWLVAAGMHQITVL